MDTSPIPDLVQTLRGVAVVVAAVFVVGFFATLAVLLWVWRKVALEEEDVD